ncbi:MAG: ArsA-related P-loop ATPase, partial [Halodesulfurarchaeum sp.]
MCEDCGTHGEDGGHSHPSESDHGHSHGHAPDHTHVEAERADLLSDGIRVAVTGKGGVGKTTLSAAIASHLAAHRDVVAVDADPDMNLAGTLGVAEPPPITTERELIEERAGGSGLVNLTPEVKDVLDSHSTGFGDGGRLLTIGAPSGANSGCMCPENCFVRTLVSTALGEDTVVLDMEAGVEHLGRGTAESVDAMLVVVEPSQASIETATRIREFADELGIENVQ